MANILRSLRDCHCHLDVDVRVGDGRIIASHIEDIGRHGIPNRFFHLMSTNHIDILVLNEILGNLSEDFVVPYFGIHPWYSHLFSELSRDDFASDEEYKESHYRKVLDPGPDLQLLDILPIPFSLEEHLKKIEQSCIEWGQKCCAGIGEIGLDKLFRIPTNGFYGNQSSPLKDTDVKLSPCKVTMKHQELVFVRQLSIANELRKPVSLHCVKAHGLLYELAAKRLQPNIPAMTLHSYSGSVDQATMWVREFSKKESKLYFSFSNYINGVEAKREMLTQLLSKIRDEQVLVETDFGIEKYIKSPEKIQDYFRNLTEIFETIATIKKWSHENGLLILDTNSGTFTSCSVP